MSSNSNLVPGIGKPPYDQSIVGDYFFFEGRLVMAYRLVGGDSQVAVMDMMGEGCKIGYPSVSQLVPAVTSDLADKHKYNATENRCDDLERRLESLERLERKGD